MNSFLKDNKNLLSYSLILLTLVPIFGINFFISFLGNVLILLFLLPLFILILVILFFNSFKSKINACSNCGSISLGLSGTCKNCGSVIENFNNVNKTGKTPSESIIEIKAEEIK